MPTDTRRRIGALALLCLLPMAAHAGELARQMMPTPLAPGGTSRLTLAMPPTLDPREDVWVAYRMYAISAKDDPSGDIVMSGSFDGVQTPMGDMTVVFSASRMDKTTSAGTIGQQLEAAHGKHSDAELVATMGQGLFDAYTALNRRQGAILQGTILKTLPPPGEERPPLLVEVERDSDLHPAGVEVIVGQGDVPADLTVPIGQRPAFRFGKLLFVLALLGVAVWGLRRLRRM